MLNQADMIIPVTDMGKRVLLNLELKNVTNHIYLGMDFNLKCNSATKCEAFGQHIPEDSFIFMTMGRNISRKKLDMVVLAFCEFLKTRQDKDRFKLYIHTNINEHKDGTDLLTMIVNLGLASHIILPKSFLNNVNPPIEELYRRYKACDCYIGLPGGEGFGYGFSQSMMHGKPIIYLNYGGHAEYLQGRGLPVKPKGFYFADYIFMSFALPDIDDAVIQMNRIVNDENLRNELGKKAYDFAKENFDWITQGKKFISTIEMGYDNCDKSLFNFNLKRVM
jgi:glycosyltransferase involved in cell wall biosynthesis